MHERHYRLFIPCLIGLADSASASGTRAAQMEPLGTIWNARRATGTAAGSGTREAQLERRRLLGRALALLERRIAVTRVRVCDGNAMNVR